MSYLTYTKKQQEDYLKRTQIWPSLVNHSQYLQKNIEANRKLAIYKPVVFKALVYWEARIIQDYLEFEQTIAEVFTGDGYDVKGLTKLFISINCCYNRSGIKDPAVKVEYLSEAKRCSGDDSGVFLLVWWMIYNYGRDFEFFRKSTGISLEADTRIHTHRAELALIEGLRIKIECDCKGIKMPYEWTIPEIVLKNVVDREHTKRWNRFALEEAAAKVNRLISWIDDYGAVHQVSVFDIVMYRFERMTGFKTWKEEIEERRLAGIAKRKSRLYQEKLIARLKEVGYNKTDARSKFSESDFKILCELDEVLVENTGKSLFAPKIPKDSPDKVAKKIEEIWEQYKTKGKITQTQRNYLSRHGTSLKGLKNQEEAFESGNEITDAICKKMDELNDLDPDSIIDSFAKEVFDESASDVAFATEVQKECELPKWYSVSKAREFFKQNEDARKLAAGMRDMIVIGKLTFLDFFRKIADKNWKMMRFYHIWCIYAEEFGFKYSWNCAFIDSFGYNQNKTKGENKNGKT